MLQEKLTLKQEKIESLRKFKKNFILQFTEELIRHSTSGEVLELKNILKEKADEEKKEIKQEKKRIKQIISKKEIPTSIKKETPLQKITIKPQPRPIMRRPPILRIPAPKLPAHLEYLRPTPTKNIEIDLDKLNSLIKDPAVKVIEVNPDEKVIVNGTMGRKSTNITLNKEEIKKIIEKFSEAAKIPLHEGIFRVVIGKLILSAIVSEVVGSKFIIRKMFYSPAFRR